MVGAVLAGDGLERIAEIRHSARRRAGRGDRAAAGHAGGGMGAVRALRSAPARRRQARASVGGDGRGADRLRRARARRRADARDRRQRPTPASTCTWRPSPRSPRSRSPRRATRPSRRCAARSSRSCARARTSRPRDIVRRARRLGTDLSEGAVALVADPQGRAPGRLLAAIAAERADALAQTVGDRVYALIPAIGRGGAPGRARGWAARRRSGSPPATPTRPTCGARSRRPSSCSRSPPAAHAPEQDIGGGTYRLLFRVLASHPEEVRSFYEDTVAAVVRYDEQYTTELLGHARGLPRPELQHERDGAGDLRPPPHRLATGSSGCASSPASTRSRPRTASGSASG